MWPLEIIRRLRPRARKPAATAGMARHLEPARMQDLSTIIEFRRDNAGSLMALFFLGLAVFILAALWIGTFSKQESVRGIVLGAKGSQRIVSVVEGTVSTIWVKQGDSVQKNQKLLTIVPQQTAGGSGPLAQARLDSLQTQLSNVRAQIAEAKRLASFDASDLEAFEDNAEKLLSNLHAQESEASHALVLQEEIVSKMRKYLDAGYATRDTLTAQERTRQDYLRQLSEIRFQVTQLISTRIERRRLVQQNNSNSNSLIAQLTRNEAEIASLVEQAKAAIATDVLATSDGRVVAVNVREGAAVATGDIIAAIGDPEAPFTIGLEAPSKTMGLLEIGQRVILKYDAFPFKTFGVKYGRIISISKEPMSIPKETEAAAASVASVEPALAQASGRSPAQSKFLVEVEPENATISAYGVDRPILIGSTLTADVVVERRRLIDWIIDPVLAMRGRN